MSSEADLGVADAGIERTISMFTLRDHRVRLITVAGIGYMGAGTWQYWRHVGGPVLLPSFLGCLLLLFGSAFSAYATAEALTGGTIALTPIQIGALLNGNVVAGQENLGYALGVIMVVIIAIVMVGYTILQRRTARWLR